MLTSSNGAAHRKPEEQQLQDDDYICSLDPLQADIIIKLLPALNRQKEVASIASYCYKLLPHPDTLEAFDYFQAAAAMRDLGFFLGSMKRHGLEPVQAVPELDYVLDVLGSKLDMPPRDTLLHYTSWNPRGFRRRTYTGTPDEDNLIQSVQMAMVPLIKAIYALETMHGLHPAEAAFAACAQDAAQAFEAMVAGVVYARKHVSLQYFAQELRLYFDPIALHGKSYLGPGAVEMPMFVYDHLLWSSNNQDPAYVAFKETYLPYILPYLRNTYEAYRFKPSLLDHFCAYLKNAQHAEADVLQAIRHIRSLLQLLKSFRMPHKAMAEGAYKMAGGEAQQRSHGSGGYTPEILQVVLHHMRAAIQAFEISAEFYEKLPRA